MLNPAVDARENQPVSNARAVANTLKGSLGNLVEWYDVYVYTVFLTFFEPNFFGAADKDSEILAYAVFAVTFLMRPLGSWYFGRYADRHGRRAALTFSVSLMAGCSFLIGIMPSRVSIGVWALIALMALRIVQGFATGGEYGTSATYMSEAAVAGRRGYFSSFQYVTLVGGQVLAQTILLIMAATMSHETIASWGWRIAFILGGVGAVVVLIARRTMDESLSEAHLERVRSGQDQRSGTLKELFTGYWRQLLMVFFLTAGGTMCFYLFSVTGPAIVKKSFAESGNVKATLINLAALLFLMLLQPAGGLLSDKIGRRKVYLGFCFGALAYAWFFVLYMPKQSSPWVALGMLLLAYVILTGYTSINAIVKAEQFPTHVRALGLGLSYALANSVFGGTAPLIHAWMTKDGNTGLFAIYVTAVIACTTFVTFFFLKDRELE